MGKLLLILCLIANVSFGADEILSDAETAQPFFNQLILIFYRIFSAIQKNFFETAKSIYVSGVLSAMLTIVILIYATRKIREGTFEFPKDVIEIIIFLLMITFVNYCLHNYNNLRTILNYLDIPADTIANVVTEHTNKAITVQQQNQRNIGGILEQLLKNIYQMQDRMIGSTSISFLWAALEIIIKTILYFVYAWFSFILVASTGMTYILTFLQAEFWKMFGVIMIPLIYFKATRGMVIFWAKTIIALSLISAFVIIIASLSLTSENVIVFQVLGKNELWEISKDLGMSYSLIGTIIISKIILITFLKEIPAMINGMLGTQAGGSTGAFANSVAMGSIGAAAAGAGFATFKGAMGIKNLALGKKGSSGGKNADTGSASSEGLLQKGAKLTGNVTKGIGSTIATGLKNSNSSTAQKIGQGMSNIAQGASNLSQGKAWGTPKAPPK